MLRSATRLARAGGINTRRALQGAMRASLLAALREQDLSSLCEELRRAVPDISGQYTTPFNLEEFDYFWELKIRALHAFQTRLALDVLAVAEKPRSVVDVGDSAGTHLSYLRALGPEGAISSTLSVNLDPDAVDKIRAQGGRAVLCRAEELGTIGQRADLMICFETLEHFLDPIGFLRRTAIGGAAERLLVTVPLVRESRMGLDYLRSGEPFPESVGAESLHIFELSPYDWKLLCRFSGWRTEMMRIYRQFPKRGIMRLMAPFWRRYDFEGFVGLALVRDLTAASAYRDWPPELSVDNSTGQTSSAVG